MTQEHKHNPSENAINALVEAVGRRKPALARVIETHGQQTLLEYSSTFAENGAEHIQSADDFISAASMYAENLLGSNEATSLRNRLTRQTSILTANHHGPDFLSLTMQGNVVFSLGEEGVLPVFAFGGVPLNNLTYARGIKFTGGAKVNIFPDSQKACLVSVAPPFTEEMVDRAIARTEKLAQSGKISDLERTAAEEILRVDYKDPEVLRQSSLSDQSVIINKRLWERMFSQESRETAPKAVFLEMEKVTTSLLAGDIDNPNSLIYQTFFNPQLRAATIKALSGHYGCWNQEQLAALNDPQLEGQGRRDLATGAGTTFFWGIDQKGRRVPLTLQEQDNNFVLHGYDDSSEEHSIPFTQEGLKEALTDQRVIPSLFTCFTAVAFARGFKCYGGFMQTDYLTEMKHGLTQSLFETGFDEWSKKVTTVPTENYSTGMLGVVTVQGNGKINPAGTLDIIAMGGLTPYDIAQLGSLTVKEANALGLPDMYPIVYREGERDAQLASISTNQVFSELSGKLVTIRR